MTGAVNIPLIMPVEALPQLSPQIAPGSEAANAHILVALGFQRTCRYIPETGRWRRYEDGLWVDVADPQTLYHQVGTVLRPVVTAYLEGEQIGGGHRPDARTLATWQHNVGQARVLAHTLQIASGYPEVVTPLAEWNWAYHLLNVQNGVLDLRTGILRPHDPDDLMTMRAEVKYNPQASHPTVEALLRDLGEEGREDYLARVAGRALSGRVEAEELILHVGPGGTGKGSLISALQALLGDYAVSLPIQALLYPRHGENPEAPRPYLTTLLDKRLAVASEPSQGSRLNVALVKNLTGRDPVTVRGLFREPFEFRPCFSLWIQSNYDLHFGGGEKGMERRLRVIPYERRPAVARLNYKLELQEPDARSALLTWALRGYQRWYADGEHYDEGACEVVTRATERYWKRQKPLTAFFEDCLIVAPGGFAPSSLLEKRLAGWVESQGLEGETGTGEADLYKALRAEDILPGKQKQIRGWKGVTLRGEDDLT